MSEAVEGKNRPVATNFQFLKIFCPSGTSLLQCVCISEVILLGSRLSGQRPSICCRSPRCRLKAPLGLSLLRCAAQTRACLWQTEQAHHANNEKQEVPDGELPVVHIAIVCSFNRKFYKQSKSQQPVCDMQFTVVANESNRELRWQGASGCWVFVKQFSRNDTATACQDWLRVPG